MVRGNEAGSTLVGPLVVAHRVNVQVNPSMVEHSEIVAILKGLEEYLFTKEINEILLTPKASKVDSREIVMEEEKFLVNL